MEPVKLPEEYNLKENPTSYNQSLPYYQLEIVVLFLDNKDDSHNRKQADEGK